MNRHTAASFVTEHRLIELLVAEVRSGFGITPFLGSGCSAHSGILMGGQFSDYLGWTVVKCVADRRGWQATDIGGRRWNLRGRGWPPYPTVEQLNAARVWTLKHFTQLAESVGLHVEDDALTNRIKSLTNTSPGGPGGIGLERLLYAPLVPPFLRHPNARDVDLTDGRNQRALHQLLTDRGLVQGGLMLPGISPTSEDAIVERAIRSLYDWRSTLRFLSELKLAPDDHTLLLDEPDNEVVNGFNVHITRGRRPNLIHTMLCHLRQPARMRVILTTNFDDLIEKAFAAQHRNLVQVSVSKEGSLPDADEVHALDTVVKLHGTTTETRADFTLDDLPSIADRKRFFNYVRGGKPDSPESRFVPSHLLVAGYSGQDARCIQLMKSVLEGDPKARIFWLCNTKRDTERLAALFPEHAYAGRIVGATTERVDLFLYELHQQLCLSLPPGSLSYHINHNVAPVSGFRPSLEPEHALPAAAKTILAAADWLEFFPTERREIERSSSPSRSERREDERKILVIDGPSGVLNAMRATMDELGRSRGMHKVWLELEDYADAASVAHDLLQIIAERRGVFQISHELCPQNLCEPDGKPAESIGAWIEHLKLVEAHLGIDPTQWVVALYGRNGPGGCQGWEEGRFWNDHEYRALEALLLALRARGFNVLYAPYTRQRLARDKERRAELTTVIGASGVLQGVAEPRRSEIIKDAFSCFAVLPTCHDQRLLEIPPPIKTSLWTDVDLSADLKADHGDHVFMETVRGVLRLGLHLDVDADDSPNQRHWRFRLLHGASLFRQSRHYTAFLSEGVLKCPKRFNAEGFDNDLIRNKKLESFLAEFDDNPRVFYRKPGGFAWLYRDVRLALRCLTEAVSAAAQETAGGAKDLVAARKFRSRSHFHIGEWYLRAFWVSGHANPVLEAAYHYYQSALAASDASNSRLELSMDIAASPEAKNAAKKALLDHRIRLWRRGVRQLVGALRRSSSALRFWLGKAQFQAWFGGPPQAIPDRLLAVCASLVEELHVLDPNAQPDATISDVDRAVLTLLEDELTQLSLRLQRRMRLHSALSLQGVHGSARPGPPAPSFQELNLWSESPRWCAGSEWPSDARDAGGKALLEKLASPALVAPTDPLAGNGLALNVLEEYSTAPGEALEAFGKLVEWTYMQLCRAKRLEHAVPLDPEPFGPLPTNQAGGATELLSWQVPAGFRRFLTPLFVREQWVHVCRFANAVVESSGWLPPGSEEFVSLQISKTLAMYGIALARLHRFSEAHRRLNHAHALLGSGERAGHLVRLGIIDLGRAEAYLLEALLIREVAAALEQATCENWDVDSHDDWLAQVERELWNPAHARHIDGKDDPARLLRYEQAENRKERIAATWDWLQPQLKALSEPLFVGRASTEHRQVAARVAFRKRLHLEIRAGFRRNTVARCDDAWGCLERAEQLIGGRTHSPLWWSRLRTQQLHVLSVAQPSIRPIAQGEDSRNDDELTAPRRAHSASYRALTSRVRSDGAGKRHRLWREGVVAAPDNWYSRLRLLDYFARATLTALRSEELPLRAAAAEMETEFKQVGEKLRPKLDDQHARDPREAQYLRNVEHRIELVKRMESSLHLVD